MSYKINKIILINKLLLVSITLGLLSLVNCNSDNRYRDNPNNDQLQEDRIQDDELNDGTFDATVTTESGSYQVPVKVTNGEVEYVDWPNGGQMTLSGATIHNRYAEGTNSRGQTIIIEIE